MEKDIPCGLLYCKMENTKVPMIINRYLVISPIFRIAKKFWKSHEKLELLKKWLNWSSNLILSCVVWDRLIGNQIRHQSVS